MEKLQPYLIQLRKHHFWVLSVIVLVAGLVGWFMASSALSTIFDDRLKKDINPRFDKVDAVMQKPNHPNEDFKKGVEGKTELLKANVLQAWKDVYRLQTDKVLQWPDQLGTNFVARMKHAKPNERIEEEYREIYQNYIKEEFPRLLKIIDAQSFEESQTAKPANPLDRKAEEARKASEHDYKVIWDDASQQAVASQLNFPITPNSDQVRATQEDLWVYRALLTIIANVNKDATGHHNAKIKEINDLSIGQQAAQEFLNGVGIGRIERLATAPGAPGAAPPVVAAVAPNAADASNMRYVDAQGKPLSATAQVPPEFKRMPVHLRLVMDQRDISQLLTECANAPLPVEIRQLRLNSEQGPGVPRGGPVRGGALPRRGPEIMGPGGLPLQQRVDESNPYDLPVELHGIIYIFNPPDEAKLAAAKAEGAAEAAPADQTVPANGTPPANGAVPANGTPPAPAPQ